MKKIMLLSLKDYLKNRSCLINSVLLGLILGISVLFSTFNSTINNFLKNDINNDFYSNTVLVGKEGMSSENMRKELEEIKNVVGVFSAISRTNGLRADEFKKNGLSGGFEVYAANNKSLPKILYGEKFPNKTGNYIICPENFYPNDSNFTKLNVNKMIKLDKKLNKIITLKYNNLETDEEYEIDYKLVGIYKNNLTSIDEGICFVNEESLKKIFLSQVQDQENLEISDQVGFYVQVDNQKHLKNVKHILKEKNYNITDTSFIDSSIYDSLFKKNETIKYILYFLIFILSVVILIKTFKDFDGKNNILLYLGFNSINIAFFNAFSIIILVLFSILFSVLFGIFISGCLKLLIFYKPLLLNKWALIIDYSAIVFPIILLIILAFIFLSIYLKKLKRDFNYE